MIPRDPLHVDGCNCDYDCDQDGYFQSYTDPRCEELEYAGGLHTAAHDEGKGMEPGRPR